MLSSSCICRNKHSSSFVFAYEFIFNLFSVILIALMFCSLSILITGYRFFDIFNIVKNVWFSFPVPHAPTFNTLHDAIKSGQDNICFKTFSKSSQLQFIYSISESSKRQTLPFSSQKKINMKNKKQTTVMMISDTDRPLVTHLLLPDN